MSLYRKHRPQKFAEVVGQEHIKKVLTNALRQDRIGHAYLFSGPRGTGKTTMARLLAKALNCKQRAESREQRVESRDKVVDDNESPLTTHPSQLTFEPCNECLSCVEITADRSLDVIEIDAASNRGIDEIRELRDKVRFAPTSGRYKIYIIDEVHMLTKEAFNALLKTLEEPPRHAIFIMATTELQRVPDTILSRTQQFDFKRASQTELINNLKLIIKKENFQVDDEAVELVARAGDGSFRDSVSILDQITSLGEQRITLDHVQEVLGLVPQNLLDDFINLLGQGELPDAIKLINQIYEQGYDLIQFNQAVIEVLRQKMLQTGDYTILAKIKKFIEAGQEMKYAQVPQIPLEVAVVESCNIAHVTYNKEIGDKVTPLVEQSSLLGEASDKEEKIIQKSKVKSQNYSPKLKTEELVDQETEEQKDRETEEQKNRRTEEHKDRETEKQKNRRTEEHKDRETEEQKNRKTEEHKDRETEKQEENEIKNEIESKKSAESVFSVSAESVLEKWPEVVEAVAAENHSLSLLLKESQPLKIEPGKVHLGVKFKFYAERISAPDKYAILTTAVEKVLGDKYAVECVVEDNSKVKSQKSKVEDDVIDSNLISEALEVFGE